MGYHNVRVCARMCFRMYINYRSTQVICAESVGQNSREGGRSRRKSLPLNISLTACSSVYFKSSNKRDDAVYPTKKNTATEKMDTHAHFKCYNF